MEALVIILLAIAGGLVVGLLLQRARANKERLAAAAQLAAINEDLTRTTARVNALAKYEPLVAIDAYVTEQRAAAMRAVADAEQHAQDQRRQAERLVAEAQSRASVITSDADQRAQSAAAATLAEAKTKAAERVASADRSVEDAHRKAAEVIDAATRRAQEIAGDAFEAMRNAKQLEETARAMKNVIDGYGDRYLVPTFSMLDELGEEFSFIEAGQKLKNTRERVRDMIKRGQAATCDYAEPNRRETAIHFVLDAFNGKCDTALADVRHDNLGTLDQKIRDAFSLVNKNGQAFRNARIDPNYLQARLDELRWAVAVHEIKLRDREEQRALKEQIREEERAQREYERAMKEAAKEEETIRKAMEKARREIDKAGEAQKAKYEQQLAELTMRLRAAEEKNQRALSMAQQTKKGTVYIISNVGSFGEHVYKIGMTRRIEPLDRVRELGDASVPFEFDVHALISTDDAPALERELQKHFLRHQVNKVNPRKEFFRVPLAEIRATAEAMGRLTSWTMTAECREYRETLAVEKTLASKAAETAWVESQVRKHDSLRAEAANDVEEMAS